MKKDNGSAADNRGRNQPVSRSHGPTREFHLSSSAGDLHWHMPEAFLPAVITVAADVLSNAYSHRQLDDLFEHINVGQRFVAALHANKTEKCKAWLRHLDSALDGLSVLGKALEEK